MGRALIVSAGASSNEYLCARLTELGYTRPLIVPSGAEARRRMLESDFELIVVNAPLPDEFGHDLCATAVEKTDAGVVFLAKAAVAEHRRTRLPSGRNSDCCAFFYRAEKFSTHFSCCSAFRCFFLPVKQFPPIKPLIHRRFLTE